MSPILTSWDTLESNKSSAARFDLSWDEDFYHEIMLKSLLFKRRLHFLRKKIATKEASIPMKSILNLPLKNLFFKEKLDRCAFKKCESTSWASKGSSSYYESHEFTFTQVTKNSLSSHLPVFFERLCSSSSETSTEKISEEHNLHSKSSFQHANFMELISSRFESTRTKFRKPNESSFECEINPSSSQHALKVKHET